MKTKFGLLSIRSALIVLIVASSYAHAGVSAQEPSPAFLQFSVVYSSGGILIPGQPQIAEIAATVKPSPGDGTAVSASQPYPRTLRRRRRHPSPIVTKTPTPTRTPTATARATLTVTRTATATVRTTPSPSPTASAFCSVMPQQAHLVDHLGNVYTRAGGVIDVNGVADGYSAHVNEVGWEGEAIWP